MITPINQTHPQFKAKMYSNDISVLFNEAKRAKYPNKAKIELVNILRTLEYIPGKEATLQYSSGNPNGRFKILLDGKKNYSSNINFTEALKKGLNFKFGPLMKTGTEDINSKITSTSIQQYALDA